MKIYRKLVVALGAITVIAAAGATVALANPGSLINTTVLGHRATLSDRVHVNQDRVKFQTKDPTDVMVQTITFLPQGTRSGSRPVRRPARNHLVGRVRPAQSFSQVPR